MKNFPKKWTALLLLSLSFIVAHAQRPTDKLGRGLVAMQTGNGVFLSWRKLGEEYYDVTYNVYRNGTKLNATTLKVSNYQDTGGSSSDTYTVSAVVRGVEQSQCSAVSVWPGYRYKLIWDTYTGYLDIPLVPVYNSSGDDVSEYYIANDAEVADLDGDGEMEIIIKRLSTLDSGDLYVSRTDGCYDRIDAYKMDGTLLWWIDVGPNMVSGGSHELNIIAYDWDGDGKAEVLLRGGDDMMVHGQRGGSRTEYPQRIGTSGVDTRSSVSHVANMTYTNTGNEYLVYMDGDHGIIYDAVRYMSYPLERGSASDWGDNYGHRSSKYFFGAPFLDGHKPSIFLARGIYTRHKMVAYDVDASTHSLTQRWYWENNDGWSSPWYGNGNHNYCIADVDMDGRDEIVYGSMVIDDNGQGLSTTGLGHGDALHCSDFDPFRHGLEIFACNETNPASNYRDATTSKIYHRLTSSDDDGRAICANFSNTYPGAAGRTTQTGMVSCVADEVISELGDYIAWSDLNFRIYWDGDLLSEVLNSPGTEKEAKIEKPGTGRVFTSSGCQMNNYTKNHPCFSGDILGDWREELIVRVGSGTSAIRIYTTGIPTDHDIYTLWHDHQYRQAMVWQMHAYNQPPHLSYFLGELEDITVAPPPLTNTDRTVIDTGTTIDDTYNDLHILHNEYANTTLTVAEGAAPYITTINTPTWVQGTNSTDTSGNPTLTRTTYTTTLNGGGFTGSMRLIKQGDGILNMAAATHTHTGETNIWGGTVNFDGTMTNSPVWMNRHTTLNSSGTFRSITMTYGASLHPGGDGIIDTLTTDTLNLKYGARVVIDFSGTTADQLNTHVITTETKDWDYGPAYQQPVFQFNNATTLADDRYVIGTCTKLNGSLEDILLEGLADGKAAHLEANAGTLYLVVGSDYSYIDENGNPLPSEAAEGTFYLYNPAMGLFLTGDNTWGTQASVSHAATPVTLAESGDGFTIETQISNGGDAHYLGSGLFMDSTVETWLFRPTETNNGTLAYLLSTNGTNYMTTTAGATTLTTTTDATSENAKWVLYTREALIEALTYATGPTDATFLLYDADFGRNDLRSSYWNGGPAISGGTAANTSNYNAEKFNTTFDVYQEFTGVPNGTYIVSCQGFYRNGGITEAAAARAAGTETLQALLYANSSTTPLPSIFEAAGEQGSTGASTDLGYIPNGQADASVYFNAGLYEGSSVEVTVTDGTLRVGVKKTETVELDWTCFDHFRITYQGVGTPSEAAAGTFYLYNPASGRYLNNGNAWGTRAILTTVGLDLTLADSDNAYTINTGINRNGLTYLNDGLYTDQVVTTWTLGETTYEGELAYTLTANGTDFMAYTGVDDIGTTTDNTSDAAKWLLYTRDTRIEMLKKATPFHPIDATFLIGDPDFSLYDTRISQWQGSPAKGGTTGIATNQNGEKFNTDFDVYQEFTGIPNGTYKLTCSGYYRNGGWAEAQTAHANGTESLNALLYANNATTALPSIFDEAGANDTVGVESELGYIPDSQTDASSYFNAGLYAGNTVWVNVTDGNLTVGVKKTSTTTNDWTCFDHFRLTYYGKNPLDSYWTALVAAREAITTNGETTWGAATAAVEQYGWTTAQYATKSQEEISTAIATLNNGTAISNAAQDATSLLVNADLSNTELTDAFVPYGWTGIGTASGGDAWVRTQDGSQVFNYWHPTLGDWEMNQAIANLPQGVYRFTVDMGTEGFTTGSAATLVGFIIGDYIGATEPVHTLNTGTSRSFDTYTCAAELTASNSLTVGIRAVRHYLQAKNFTLEYIGAPADHEEETDGSYLRQDYFWAGRSAYEFWAIDDKYRNARGVTLYPDADKKNQIIYCTSASQFADTRNKVAGGTCANLVITDGYGMGHTQGFTATSATYTRTVGSEWTTLILPYPVSGNTDTKLYKLVDVDATNAENGVMYFTSVETLPANTPCVMRSGTAPDEFSLNASNVGVVASTTINDATEVAEWSLIGTFEPQTLNATATGAPDYYYIANNKFWHATGTLSVNPFRAYFASTAGGQTPQRFDITTDGYSTAIGQPSAGGTRLMVVADKGCVHLIASAPCSYRIISVNGALHSEGTLQDGDQRTVSLTPGIYVINGQKMLIR